MLTLPSTSDIGLNGARPAGSVLASHIPSFSSHSPPQSPLLSARDRSSRGERCEPSSRTFHPFSKLPQELQLQIWNCAANAYRDESDPEYPMHWEMLTLICDVFRHEGNQEDVHRLFIRYISPSQPHVPWISSAVGAQWPLLHASILSRQVVIKLWKKAIMSWDGLKRVDTGVRRNRVGNYIFYDKWHWVVGRKRLLSLLQGLIEQPERSIAAPPK